MAKNRRLEPVTHTSHLATDRIPDDSDQQQLEEHGVCSRWDDVADVYVEGEALPGHTLRSRQQLDQLLERGALADRNLEVGQLLDLLPAGDVRQDVVCLAAAIHGARDAVGLRRWFEESVRGGRLSISPIIMGNSSCRSAQPREIRHTAGLKSRHSTFIWGKCAAQSITY